MLRQRNLPAGFIATCLPTKTTQLPSGSQWLHEIKHDGFRIIARHRLEDLESETNVLRDAYMATR
jgi:ATP-dependent DNA ligase